MSIASSDTIERSVPVYSRIEEQLRASIEDGTFAAGDRLPSETELAQNFRTTRTTVRQALSRLVFEGLIVRHVGRGSFVASEPMAKFPIDTRQCLCFEDQVALEGKSVSYRSPSFDLVPAPADVAKELKIPIGSEVFRLERLRVIDERPVCLEIRFLPASTGSKVTGEMLMKRSAHSFVGEILGMRIPTIRVLVSAVIADADLSERLDVPRGTALLIRDNWHFDIEGRPLMFGKSIFRGDIRTEYVLGHDPNPPRLPETP
ncbi:GntR family transcriptional regulator [Agaricicola taiwanensis]|uniref:GntR family transcriptional regulator n=1 Tax=Agaricicola taiwanensis TaxID=591372 RepID=UPI0016648C92|nr:GntR family transcriptional regulator [Agaricicola taiwanensis]